MNPSLPKARIDLVDALRGFALLGILLIHNIDHFDLNNGVVTDNAFLSYLNKVVNEVVWFIFSGRSYALLALLFGFSFFIQSENSNRRGTPFAGRFIWRMALLFAFGVYHVMFYSGEILSCYAVAALFIIPFRNCSNKVWLILALVCMLQPWELGKLTWALCHPGYVQPAHNYTAYRAALEAARTSDSFLEVARENLDGGFKNAHYFMWSSGRYFQTLGLFFLGMFLGRRELFRDTDQSRKFWLRMIFVSLLGFMVVYPLSQQLPLLELRKEISSPLRVLLNRTAGLAFMAFLTSLFATAWFNGFFRKFQTMLVPYGRMSLSNYIAMSMIGSFLYYHYGLGLYATAGVAASFGIGLCMLTAQVLFSRWWLSRHKRGPLEWLWTELMWIGNGKTRPKTGKR